MAESVGGPGAVLEFGLALYQFRLSRGLSLRALARRIGLSGHGGLAEYEKGRRIPPEDLVTACERVLGVSNGQLRELREKALAERAAAKISHRLELPAVRTAAHQVPIDIADFTGRDAELAWIQELTAGVVVVTGKPGVGKTALAVHASHLLMPDYPYAQLYCDLGGVSHPVDPADVLASATRALGTPEPQVPSGVVELAGLFRSLLHERRVLIVLDNASDEEQVRPLLPGGANCLVIVTSRSQLSGLAGVRRIPLDVPDLDVAVRLLSEIVGPQRIEAEPDAAAELATACGQLPLAVRIAGNRLAARPMWTLSYLSGRLADERNRLAWLKAGDLEVRSAFALSYEGLTARARTLFARLSLVPGADFGPQLTAALGDRPETEADELLDELAEASLIEPAATPGRYRMHELLRLYADERLRADAHVEDALRVTGRMVGWLLDTARDAAVLLAPPTRSDRKPGPPFVTNRGAALDWLDAERENVLGAAAVAGDERVVRLLATLVWYFDLRCAWRDLLRWSELAQGAARSASSSAFAWNCLGLAFGGLGRFRDAIGCHERAAELARSAGDVGLTGSAHDKLGVALSGVGRHAEAVAHHERAVEICGRLGDRWGEAAALNHLGCALYKLGRPVEAVDCHRGAAELMGTLGDTRGEAMAIDALGLALSELGQLTKARDCHDRALAVFRAIGDNWAAGTARYGLGRALHGLGRHQAALDELRHAHSLFELVRDRLWEARTLRVLGAVLADAGDLTQARVCWQQALMRYVDLGSPEVNEVRVLLDG